MTVLTLSNYGLWEVTLQTFSGRIKKKKTTGHPTLKQFHKSFILTQQGTFLQWQLDNFSHKNLLKLGLFYQTSSCCGILSLTYIILPSAELTNLERMPYAN